MNGLDTLLKLAGHWQGTYRLWLPPATTPYESQSTVVAAGIVQDKFVRMDYDWSFDGSPQAGSLLLGWEAEAKVVTVIWIDAWHNQDKIMICRGTLQANGGLEVLGTYAAPPGPDWGWRTVIEPGSDDTLHLSMFNLTPDGQQVLAVEVTYSRV